jgi:hypothetical protein
MNLSELQDMAILKMATEAKDSVYNGDDTILLVNTVLQVWFMCQALRLAVLKIYTQQLYGALGS